MLLVAVQCSRFHTWLWELRPSAVELQFLWLFCVCRIMGFLKNRPRNDGGEGRKKGNVSRGSSINFAPFRTDRSHFCSVSLSYRIIYFLNALYCISPLLLDFHVRCIFSTWMDTSRFMLAAFAFFLIYCDSTNFFSISFSFISHQRNVRDNHWTAILMKKIFIDVKAHKSARNFRVKNESNCWFWWTYSAE